MPKLIYTATKGLYEDNSTEGFSVSDVAVANKAYGIELGSPVYTFTILDAMNHATSTTNNEEYHDIDLTVYNAAGTAVTVTLDNTAGDFDGVGGHPTTTTTNLCTFNGSAGALVIAKAIGAAFSAADATLMHSISTDTDVHIIKIWCTGFGRLSDTKNDLISATASAAGSGVIVQANNGGNSKAAFAAGDILAAVVTQGATAATVAALDGTTFTKSLVFTTVSESENTSTLDTNFTDPTTDDGTFATSAEWGYLGSDVALADGDAEGQSIILINNCSYRAVNVNATNNMGSATQDNALLHAGSVLKLTWNGTFWFEEADGKHGTVTLS